MMIRIIYQDGRFDYIKILSLISIKKIEKYYRYSEGWVTPSINPIRGVGGDYDGPERRMCNINNERYEVPNYFNEEMYSLQGR